MWLKPLTTTSAWENGASNPTALIQDQPIDVSDDLAAILIRDGLAEACDPPPCEACDQPDCPDCDPPAPPPEAPAAPPAAKKK
jgi:hypothetical protein